MEYEVRSARPEDLAFLYRLNVDTMKEYVEKTWGWDDALQERMFRESFDASRWQVIVVDEQDVGAYKVEVRTDCVFLAAVEILPDYQRRGLGTAVVEDFVARAEQVNLPAALQVLKVNPARRLYERLGFRVTQETDTHYYMTRATS
jgi:GNAT superfamily N-acetyltransferase